MKSLFFLIISVFLSFPMLSQENQGTIHDNFNPVNGQYINPSNIVDAKPWLDINFVGASLYARNNLVFYPNSRWWDIESIEGDPSFNTSLGTINAITDFDIKGPAFSLGIGRSSVSLFSNLRGVVNVNNLPQIMAKKISPNGISFADTGFHTINNARVKSMVWGEIGFTYGQIISASRDNMWTGAISVKRLFGFQNASFLVDNALVHVHDLENASFDDTDGKFSYAEPSLDAGRGWGFNVGLTYKKMKEDVGRYIPHSKKSGCKSVDYIYKIGASLLDVGYINFNNNAYFGEFDESALVRDIKTIDDLRAETQLHQDGSGFRAWLPAAASLQFDYNVNDLIYLNGTIVQKIPMPNIYGVERANLLAISARLETKYFGIGIPLSLQNYVNPQMGFAIRIANFTIGSDNVLPIFFEHKRLLAGDIYFSLKHTLYRSPQCKDKQKRGSRRRKSNSSNCPAFD